MITEIVELEVEETARALIREGVMISLVVHTEEVMIKIKIISVSVLVLLLIRVSVNKKSRSILNEFITYAQLKLLITLSNLTIG